MGPSARRAAMAWLGLAAAAGVTVLLLLPKSAEPDAGFHFLKARWAFDNPVMFVDVWARPLFQVVFALPAQVGLDFTRLFALALSLAAAWHTFRLAERLGFARPALAIPILFVQPVWLVYATDTMTEPLFALVFAIALRLHHSDRQTWAMAVASLLPAARPEGFAIAALWAAWTLFDRSDPRPIGRRLLLLPLLGAGTAAWWLGAVVITRDPLFILNNWPAIWDPNAVVYGRGHPLWFVMCLPVIVGPVMLVPLVAGGVALAKRRSGITLATSVLLILAMHSAIWALGRFGSVGFPRYLICVAPATALITLAGWNALADSLARFRPAAPRIAGIAAGVVSFVLAYWYVDAQPQTRDGRAMANLVNHFRRDPVPFTRFAWSHPHACILFDRNPDENPVWTADRTRNLELLRDLPEGTLVLWDRDIGRSWYHLEAGDFLSAGFIRRIGVELDLPGRLPTLYGRDSYEQGLDLLYKR